VDAPEPLTDEALEKVLVSGLQPGRVTVIDYDPTWPAAYARHHARIEQAIGDRIRLIEHVGSTAVPGLAAKPIIDVVVVVDDPEDEAAYLDDLVRAGYEVHVREPGHRCLRFTGAETANVHCYPPRSVEIRRYLALRDWLRAHADCQGSADLTACSSADLTACEAAPGSASFALTAPHIPVRQI
jgi:GrpB-like predicted nucleotidyltransferase (UPF0157 family)